MLAAPAPNQFSRPIFAAKEIVPFYMDYCKEIFHYRGPRPVIRIKILFLILIQLKKSVKMNDLKLLFSLWDIHIIRLYYVPKSLSNRPDTLLDIW